MTAAAIAAVLVLLAALSFFVLPKGAPEPIASLKNISDEGTVNVILEKDGKQIALTGDEEKPFTYLSPAFFQQAEGFKIVASDRKNDTPREIVLTRKGDHLFFTVEGFNPGALLRLSREGRPLLNNLHLDWNGRIELKYLIEGKAEQICLQIESGFTLCHDVAAGGAA